MKKKFYNGRQDVHRGATTCKFCNKVLSRVHELRRHMKTKHGYEEPGDYGYGESSNQGPKL